MRSLIRRILGPGEPPTPIAPGIYHYMRAEEAEPYRLHLRIELDGSGLLLVNAATALHLNPSAAEHAYYFVQGQSLEQASALIASRYRVSKRRARRDQRTLRDQVLTLATNRDVDPVAYLGVERTDPYQRDLSAPYRLDLALTYECDPDGELDPLARRRVDRELTTEEWKQVLERAWQAGIPHVTFTGGEPTRRPDLVELIGSAEGLGQLTGLLTNGARLTDPAYLDSIAMAGLDHILVSLSTSEGAGHAGLQAALASEVFTAAHLMFEAESLSAAREMVERLHADGLSAISLSSSTAEPTAIQALGELRELAAQLGLELIWDLPAPYSELNPIAFELPEPTVGAGTAWLYVEPDGDVLPAQGIERVLGNFLRDPWEQIWSNVTPT